MRSSLYTVLLTVMIILCIGIYYIYRETQSNSLEGIKSFAETRTVDSTICKRSTGDFEGASAGVLYIHKGRVALDTTLAGRISGRLRVLIESNGTYFVDPETEETIPRGLGAGEKVAFIDAIVFSSSWKCSPWWIPNEAVFGIPKPATEENVE